MQRHDRLYLPDGNIILTTSEPTKPLSLIEPADTESHNGVILFRVHVSVLSMHSSVFKDMFESPGHTVNEMYDGAPLVKMQDTTSELECFLNAMYHGL